MRLFVALEISSDIRDVITKITSPLKPGATGMRWSAPESMHVTLKFLGEVEAPKLEPIGAALSQIISPQPVSLQFRGVGFFPNGVDPRVMWCGVAASANLSELAANIEQSLHDLGFERESRTYVPHLTVARLNSARNVEKLVRAATPLKSYDFGAACESEFHLFESVPKKSGSEYKKLATFPFVKDPR
jgi:2'-5' RNA ligase